MNHPHAYPYQAPARVLRPLPELRDTVSDVLCSLDALCELLEKADGNKVFAVSVFALLKPLRDQLSEASCELNDTRM